MIFRIGYFQILVILFILIQTNALSEEQDSVAIDSLDAVFDITPDHYMFYENFADSLYFSANYEGYRTYADSLIDLGIFYPALCYRLGVSNIFTGKYSAALSAFDMLEEMNTDYKDYKYYVYLSQFYLGRRNFANSIDYKLLSDSLPIKHRFAPISAIELEYSSKKSNSDLRGQGDYSRIGIESRITRGLSLFQSFAIYSQGITIPYLKYTQFYEPYYIDKKISINELEYYCRADYSLESALEASIAFHHLKTKFDTIISNNNIGRISVRKYFNYWDLELEFIMGEINSSKISQYGLSLEFYPLGNANLIYSVYLSNSEQDSGSYFNHSHTLGFRTINNLWFNINATFGLIRNYCEKEALYIYNFLDPGKYKITTSLIYYFNNLSFSLGFAYQPKLIEYLNKNYVQQSINGMIKWFL
jgi:hypothetical protein